MKYQQEFFFNIVKCIKADADTVKWQRRSHQVKYNTIIS